MHYIVDKWLPIFVCVHMRLKSLWNRRGRFIRVQFLLPAQGQKTNAAGALGLSLEILATRLVEKDKARWQVVPIAAMRKAVQDSESSYYGPCSILTLLYIFFIIFQFFSALSQFRHPLRGAPLLLQAPAQQLHTLLHQDSLLWHWPCFELQRETR
jgi:hypothetical protein